MTQSELAEWMKEKFQLPNKPSPSSVSDILRSYNKLREMPKEAMDKMSAMPAKHPELEDILVKYIDDVEKENGIISSHSLRTYAELKIKQMPELIGDKAVPTFSNGWFDRFMARHGLQSRRVNGEAGLVDINSPLLQLDVEKIKAVVSKYDRKDVYKFDETGLYYRRAPNKTISKQLISGVKVDKSRLTIGLLCNSDGSDKFEPLIIGRAAKPECFNKMSGKQLYTEHN